VYRLLIAALAVLALVGCSQSAVQRTQRTGFEVEAETAKLSGGAATVDLPGASQGKAVRFADATPVSKPAVLSRQGARLVLGGRPFTFTGLDIYNAASVNNCFYTMGNGPLLADSLSAISAATAGKANVIRVWFFQRLAVRDGSRDWSAFDHTLATAKAHHVLVIPVLANQWGDCEAGQYRTEAWYRSGYRQPDAGGLVSYRAWVAEVTKRYHADPTIAAWSLMNEAEDATAKNGACTGTAASTLKSFADDVGGVAKSADPGHLLTLGTMGSGQCGTAGEQYRTVYSSPVLDLCEYHDYNAPQEPMPGDRWNGLRTRLGQCAALKKPLFVGESGIDPSKVGGTARRAEDFAAKAAAQFKAGIAGLLLWEWRADGQEGGDQYVIGPGDPALQVLARHGTIPPAAARQPATGGPGPPMGFNHYNRFGNSVNEKDMRQIADAMVANGMKAAGYQYVNLDDSWEGERDGSGQITANENFPSGIKALADYVHQRGLKFGIYTTPSARTCGGHIGSSGHVTQDVDTFAAWGVDFLKLDWCGSDYSEKGARAIAQQWHDAIGAAGRPMVLSINAGLAAGPWASRIATMWRSGDDICASWFNKTAAHAPAARDCFNKQYHDGLYDVLNGGTAGQASRAGPGHWADPDMLEIGNPGLTADEAATEFALWSMWSAPLLAGNDPRTMTDVDRLMLNSEIIAIDQDPLATMARKVGDHAGLQIWSKPLAGGDEALLLLNTTDTAADVTASLGGPGAHRIRDLGTHADLGTFTGSYTATSVRPHASVLLRVGLPPLAAPTPNPRSPYGIARLRVQHIPSGNFTPQIRLAAPGTLRVLIDGKAVSMTTPPAAASGAGWIWVSGDPVHLSQGAHTLDVISGQPGLVIDQVRLTAKG
jgi:alpha-galactosidase